MTAGILFEKYLSVLSSMCVLSNQFFFKQDIGSMLVKEGIIHSYPIFIPLRAE